MFVFLGILIFGLVAGLAIQKRSLATGMLALAILAGFAGVSFMWVPAMRASAEEIAGDRAYCLALPSQHRPAERVLDLTLPIAKGGHLSPHMMLWVKSSDTIEPYFWSYRQRRFVPVLPWAVMRHCRPRPDFLGTLRSEEPGFHAAFGGGFYVIPPDHAASHTNQNLIHLNFGTGTCHRPQSTVRHGETAIRNWQRRVLGDDLRALPASDTLRRDGEHGFSILYGDETGHPIQKFGCNRHGSCRLEFVSPPFLFDVFLGPTNPEDVPQVRARLDVLWNGFRVDG